MYHTFLNALQKQRHCETNEQRELEHEKENVGLPNVEHTEQHRTHPLWLQDDIGDGVDECFGPCVSRLTDPPRALIVNFSSMKLICTNTII